MYDDLLKRLTADGRTQFTAADIQQEMDKIFEEEGDRMAEYFGKNNPETLQPVTWQQTSEGIESPPIEPLSHDMER